MLGKRSTVPYESAGSQVLRGHPFVLPEGPKKSAHRPAALSLKKLPEGGLQMMGQEADRAPIQKNKIPAGCLVHPPIAGYPNDSF